jgi:hypothetical protein
LEICCEATPVGASAVVSRGGTLAAAEGASARCCDGRSGAETAARSLLRGSAELSIRAEKPSGAGTWSAREARDGAFGTGLAVSDVTLSTGGPL